jgi:hypothetical protein
LCRLEQFAAPVAWRELELHLGVALRALLEESLRRLVRQGEALSASFRAAETATELAAVQRELLAFRSRYARAEHTADFYGDAINTRTNEKLGAYLRGCDAIAQRAMEPVLAAASQRVPPVLTWVDRGMGASILKAGLRLWDGRTTSSVAAIKIVRHNLQRPTALVHEAGHQVAQAIGWNEQLARGLQRALAAHGSGLASAWAGWASEIAADVFAFVHTGYAAVAALHDVLAGERDWVTALVPGDPHPISYLRILLGVALCRHAYGSGPWDDLAAAWCARYPLDGADAASVALIRASRPLLPQIAATVLDLRLRALGNRPIVAIVDPARVAPAALASLQQQGGGALFVSQHWIEREPLRLLALTGYRLAVQEEQFEATVEIQERWMRKLGGYTQAA